MEREGGEVEDVKRRWTRRLGAASKSLVTGRGDWKRRLELQSNGIGEQRTEDWKWRGERSELD